MADDSNRREFLRLLGVGTGAAAGGLLVACSQPSERPSGPVDTAQSDSGRDAADGTADTADTAGGVDARDSGADTTARDTGRDVADSSADSSDTADAADTADGSDVDAGQCETTGSDVEGPFHAEGAPTRTKIAPDDEPGERMMIQGTVYGPDCKTPLKDALLDVWHANKDGDYYDASNSYRLRGQVMADGQGQYAVESIKPGKYPLDGSQRPAHVHFMVSAPGYQPLTTQMYFKGDSNLPPNDPCTGCNSEDDTLVVDFTEQQIDGQTVLVGTFDIVLEKT